jgi:hypothetical protein
MIIMQLYTLQPSLTITIQSHYHAAAVSQIYRLLASLELLGSPTQTLTTLSMGVVDFVAEPLHALFASPHNITLRTLSRAVARGSLSLLRRSLTSVFSAIGAVSGSVGRGLAVITFDAAAADRLARRPGK